MVDKEKFGEFLVSKRKEQGMTQKEFAARLYVSESAISKWERGLSYPDISLVTAICENLHITEHELITASEDYRQRQFETQAEKYRKIHRIYNGILLGGFALSLSICFFANLISSQQLSWFFIVLTAEMVAASFLTVPAMVPNRKGVWTIGSSLFSLSALLVTCHCFQSGNWIWIALMIVVNCYVILFLPYLLKELVKPVSVRNQRGLLCMTADSVMILLLILVCFAETRTSMHEFVVTALPVYAAAIILPWFLFFILRYMKWNGYFKASACFGFSTVYTVVSNSFIECIADQTKFQFKPVNLTQWNRTYGNGNVTFVMAMGLFVFAVVFTIAGIKKEQR